MAAAPSWYPVVVAAKPSIFFIDMKPRGPEEKVEIRELAESAQSKETEEKLVAAYEAEAHYATGFAVGTVGQAPGRVKIEIFTCAHLIEHVFHGGWQPIDADTVNRLYDIEVHCPHSELDWIARGGTGPRASFQAWVSSIDCSIDCMMLTAYISDMALRTETVGRGTRREIRTTLCEAPHPELVFSDVLQACDPCMMLCWPTNLIHLFYKGEQRGLRRLGLISANYPGYDMTVLEAEIGSTDGASGAPLFNLAGQVVGVLHGDLGTGHSYFIPPQHFLPFLAIARDEAAATAAAEEAAEAAAVDIAEQRLGPAIQDWCNSRRPRSARPRPPPLTPPPPPTCRERHPRKRRRL